VLRALRERGAMLDVAAVARIETLAGPAAQQPGAQ
jgi:hypothetical protein